MQMKLVVLCLLASSTWVYGQTPSPGLLEQGAPGLAPGFGGPFLSLRQGVNLDELQQIRLIEAPQTITAYTSQTYYHTDNLFLTSPDKQAANAWIGALGVSLVPYSTYHWTPRLTVEGALVRFDSASNVDYNRAVVGFVNTLGLTENNNLSWNLGLYALSDQGIRWGLGEFYRYIEGATSLNWFVPLGRSKHWDLHLSPGVSWRSSHPSWEDRFDGGALAGLLWIPSRRLEAETFFEIGYGAYPKDSSTLISRRDFRARVGSAFVWWINEHASASVSVYWLGNYSSTAGADYQIVPDITAALQFWF